MKFTLTKNKPTEAGWYWALWMPTGTPTIELVHAANEYYEGLHFYDSEGDVYMLDDMDLSWSERIPEPVNKEDSHE